MSKYSRRRKKQRQKYFKASASMLIAQHDYLGSDLRFLKEHQWRMAYHALLFFSGVIAAYKLLGTARVELCIIAGVFGLIQVVYQVFNARSLTRSRDALSDVENAMKLNDLGNPESRNIRDWLLYALPFLLLIVAGATVTIIVVAGGTDGKGA